VAQNDETIENLKRNRRQDKQIDRRDAVDVILEKRPLGQEDVLIALVLADARSKHIGLSQSDGVRNERSISLS
jgi:hypothetical protein